MFDVVAKGIVNIPNLEQNTFFGALGALVLEVTKIHETLPDIQAVRKPGQSHEWPGHPIHLVFLKSIISISLGAFVAALLIRPQEFYGAIISGITWQTIIRGIMEQRHGK